MCIYMGKKNKAMNFKKCSSKVNPKDLSWTALNSSDKHIISLVAQAVAGLVLLK